MSVNKFDRSLGIAFYLGLLGFVFLSTFRDVGAAPLKSKYYVLQELHLSSGVGVEGVSLKKLGERWSLQVRAAAGLQIEKQGVEQEHLSINELSDLLQKSLVESENISGFEVDDIQLDLRLNRDAFLGLVAALRKNISEEVGVVDNKNKNLERLAVDYLNQSELVASVCRQAYLCGLKCVEKPVDMNPLAFDPIYVGGPWSDIEKLDDLGLHHKMWFSIKLKQKGQIK